MVADRALVYIILWLPAEGGLEEVVLVFVEDEGFAFGEFGDWDWVGLVRRGTGARRGMMFGPAKEGFSRNEEGGIERQRSKRSIPFHTERLHNGIVGRIMKTSQGHLDGGRRGGEREEQESRKLRARRLAGSTTFERAESN